jgi:hypothetical protein
VLCVTKCFQKCEKDKKVCFHSSSGNCHVYSIPYFDLALRALAFRRPGTRSMPQNPESCREVRGVLSQGAGFFPPVRPAPNLHHRPGSRKKKSSAAAQKIQPPDDLDSSPSASQPTVVSFNLVFRSVFWTFVFPIGSFLPFVPLRSALCSNVLCLFRVLRPLLQEQLCTVGWPSIL